MFTMKCNTGETYAGTQIGILRMKNIVSSCTLSEAVRNEGLQAIQKRYSELDRKTLKETPPIQAYVAYYKRFGYSYPVLAQLESFLKGQKALHGENGLLQAMFLTELESMLLMAGHDAVQLALPLQLQLAIGSETYQSISGREVTAVPNDLMICDSQNVISSILRGPDYPSRITDATTDVLFTIYAPPGIETEYIDMHLHKLEERIKSFSPASDTELLQVFPQESE